MSHRKLVARLLNPYVAPDAKHDITELDHYEGAAKGSVLPESGSTWHIITMAWCNPLNFQHLDIF